MIAISLSFPAGRYHATPWGRHVNEGAVEWPPSPWRLLRSLVAVWKRTLPAVTEAEIKPIFEALAAAPPRFVLPPASTGHTRHYMPWFKKGPNDRTLVFDAFVALDPNDAAAHAIWPDATLDDPHRDLLARLLTNLNVLGRAESWCEARLLSDEYATAAMENRDLIHAMPISESEPVSRDMELVRTLCADPRSAFDNNHFTQDQAKASRRKAIATTTAAMYDPSWHLAAETLWLHKHRWSDPPGSQWVTYARPRNCFEIRLRRSSVPFQAPIARSAEAGRASSRFAAFKLAHTNGDADRLAAFPQDGAVRVAAMLRNAACRVAKAELEALRGHIADDEWHAKETWGRRVVAGHGPDPAQKRRPKDDNSPRLSYLPLPSFEPRGRGVEVVGNIRRVVIAEFTGRDTSGSIPWAHERLAGNVLIDARTGEAAAVLVPIEPDHVVQRYLGSEEGSRVWASVTPILLPGYDDGKPVKRDRLLRACLQQAELLEAVESIESRPPSWCAGVTSNAQFNDQGSSRTFKRRPDYLRHLPAVHVRITFRKPVHGPLAIGAGRHCGLGILAALSGE